MNNLCLICTGGLRNLDDVYDECLSCGSHLKRISVSKEITNEALDADKVKQVDGLTKFKIKTILKIDSMRTGILDVGSASGKFLYHVKNYYDYIRGIEINPSCISFAKNELNITLESDLRNIDLNMISLATFWHSFEHIPLDISTEMLIQMNQAKIFKILISVPNGKSFQFSLFGNKWPYYDPGSHLYQFNQRTLIKILNECGYNYKRNYFGFMYEFFGYLQGFTNLLHPINNYFYYRFKRGWSYSLNRKQLICYDLLSFILLSLFTIPSVIFCLFTPILRAGVINVVFERIEKSSKLASH